MKFRTVLESHSELEPEQVQQREHKNEKRVQRAEKASSASVIAAPQMRACLPTMLFVQKELSESLIHRISEAARRNTEAMDPQRNLCSDLQKLRWACHSQLDTLIAASQNPTHPDKAVTQHRRVGTGPAALNRKLIQAQEQERSRIARDLHDDINQGLAMLAIEIELLQNNIPDSVADINRRLTEFRDRIIAVSTAVQSMSHQLHAQHLEYLGLVAAMESFCREFALRQQLEIDFSHNKIPRAVSYEVSLCVFRIMQEALSNAAKHSKVKHFRVKLGYLANRLRLVVSDKGTGFDACTAIKGEGLGLTSMRERATMANGTLSIKSRPRGGTTIEVRVPLVPKSA